MLKLSLLILAPRIFMEPIIAGWYAHWAVDAIKVLLTLSLLLLFDFHSTFLCGQRCSGYVSVPWTIVRNHLFCGYMIVHVLWFYDCIL